MQHKECMIIRDLLPSYMEQLTNDTTTLIIEEHLEECKKCQGFYQELRKQYEEERCRQGKKDRKFFRKIIKWMLIGCISLILALFTLAALFLALVLTGGMPITTKELTDYEIIFEKRLQGELNVFPKELSEEMLDGEFSYYYQDTLFDPTVSIFLQANYTPEGYAAEVERLENIQTLLQDGRYSYPVFIAVDNHYSRYEYALLTGENQITYIYLVHVDEDGVAFPHEYLPMDYRKEQEVR